jgi:hypothetical protein
MLVGRQSSIFNTVEITEEKIGLRAACVDASI